MSYTTEQVALFDTGMTEADLFLELWPPSMPGTTILLSTHGAPHYGPAAQGTLSKAVACILSWGDTSFGFEMFGGDDFLHSLEVSCLNLELPVHQWSGDWPAPFIRGKLSDYLNLVTVASWTTIPAPSGGSGPPYYATAFFASPQGTVAHSDRYYIFKGMLYDFSVGADGRMVTIRMTEDLRWDREIEYRINKKVTPFAPAENQGLPHPISYGSFATWSHKDFDVSGLGPWSINRPYFPAVMNLATAYNISDTPDTLGSVGEARQAIYSLGLMNGTGLSLAGGSTYRSPFMVIGPGQPGMVNNESGSTGSEVTNQQLLSGNPDIVSSHMKDLRVMGRLRLREEWTAQQMIIPSKEWAGQNNDGESVNTNLFFTTDAARRQRARVIDGDRYTWFADNSNSLGDRVLIWELGQERNLGAISRVQVFSVWDMRVGTSTVTMKLDVRDTSPIITYSDTYALSSADPYQVFVLDCTTSPNFLLTDNSRAESWNFSQENSGMLLTVKWTHGSSSNRPRLIQVGLLVEYNPASRFIEYRERDLTNQASGYDALGRWRKYLQTGRHVFRILENTQFANQRRMHYAGAGIAYAPPDFPGDLAYLGAPPAMLVINNPAEVLRHLIYNYGGSQRTDAQPGYQPISEYDFNVSTGDPRDFLMCEDDPSGSVGSLDQAVKDATGDANETFKMAASTGADITVRNFAKAIMASVPGLYFFRYPDTHQSTSQTYTGLIGCVYPAVDSDVTYRRPISVRSDMTSLSWELTPREGIVTDIRLNYGYSTATSTYVRSLQLNGTGVIDPGWPENDDGTEVNDAQLGTILNKVIRGHYIYGSLPMLLNLPYIYRWHEALAIRNNIVQWRSTQRVRLQFDARIGIADLKPGDVFQLDEEAEVLPDQRYIGCNFPLRHLPHAPQTWNLTKWLVEKVTFSPGDRGVPKCKVQAIYAGDLGGF